MVSFEHKIIIQAQHSRVFTINSDVRRWKAWDLGIEESAIEGPFVRGAKGRLKLKKGPAIAIDFVEVIDGESFAVEARARLCRIRYEQKIIPSGMDTKVRSKVMLTGPLSSLYGSVMGQEIKIALQRTLAGLKSFCESNR